jgi:glyoxylase-like metal-dependent hydrolase (beta-lactamase superfamily II)
VARECGEAASEGFESIYFRALDSIYGNDLSVVRPARRRVESGRRPVTWQGVRVFFEEDGSIQAVVRVHDPRRLLLASVWLAAAGGVAAQTPPSVPSAAPAPAPLIKQDSRTKVSDHVFVILDHNAGFVPNVGIVVGDKATLIVDTGLGPRNGAIVLGEARKVSRNTEFYLTATHFHPEHDLGATAFPASAKMVRWRGQQIEADEDGKATIERFETFSPVVAELLRDAQFRAPDILFDDTVTIDLGGVHVRVFGVGPNHTRGDTALYVVEDKVLFTGDTVMSVFPAVSAQSANLAKWLDNLTTYESLQPVAIVPAHGKLIDVSYVRRYREYLNAVAMRVAAAKRDGASVDDAVAMLGAALARDFADLAPPNGAAGRVNAAVRAAYREAP